MKKASGVDFATRKSPRRAGDVASVISDNSKIVDKLKFKPEYDDLEIICRTAFEWERKVNRLTPCPPEGA
jgi:UDP-glucose 4-epimerase